MTRKPMLNRLLWLSLLVPLLAAPALCAAPRLYDVEVIIFSNNGAASDEELVDRPDAQLAPDRGTGPAGEFTALPARGYHVLFHRAWRQPAYDRARAVGYPVHTPAAGRHGSVSGTVTLLKERYLHLDVDLRMTTGAAVTAPYADGPGGAPVYRLSERRRIRSGELHYFDHPRFGMIARVTPYVSPEEQATPEEGAPGDTGDGHQAGVLIACSRIARTRAMPVRRLCSMSSIAIGPALRPAARLAETAQTA